MSYYLCRTKEQVITGSAQSSVVPEPAKIDEASADRLLIREVEEFVKKLMKWYGNTKGNACTQSLFYNFFINLS